MTRLAKAMSAFNFGRSAQSAGRDAGALATRGASPRADGSGAPATALAPTLSRPTAFFAGLFAALLLAFSLSATQASAAYQQSGSWAAPGLTFGLGADGSSVTGPVYSAQLAGVSKWTATGAPGVPATIGSGVTTSTAVNPLNGNVNVFAGTSISTFDSAGNPVGSPFTVDVSAQAQIDTDATGNIYFPNRTDKTVEVFSPAGALLDTLGPNPGGVPFNGPTSVAVDSDGNSYVGDPAHVANEVQTISIAQAQGGTYTLTFDGATTDPPLSNSANAATVQEALRALPTIDGPNVNVSGASGNNTLRTRTVTFVGTLAATDVPLITADDSNLVPVPDQTASVTVVETTPGVPYTPGRVAKFDSDGDFVSNLDLPAGNFTVFGVGVDRATDDVFVGGGATTSAADAEIIKYDSAGAEIESFGQGFVGGLIGTLMTVNSASGAVYTASSGGGASTIRLWTEVPAPTVVTGSTTGVTQTGATLNGSVNPNGVDVTDCYFEYGLTDSYGETEPCDPDAATIGDGDAAVDVSAAVSGLDPDTEYHFRLVAANADAGEIEGDDATFTTLAPPPPVPATLAADPVGSTTATLRGEVDLDGETATECYFEWGVGSAFDQETDCASLPAGAGNVPVSAAITGLLPSTGYEYRLVVTTAGGTVTAGAQSFTTAALVAPVVTTGAASAVTQTTATLNGTVNPSGDAVTSCVLEYGATTAYGSSAACSPAPGSGSANVAVSAAISGLTAETTYHFRVVATNGGGTSEGANQSFTTDATPILPVEPTCATHPALCPPPPPPPPPAPPAPAPQAGTAVVAPSALVRGGRAALRVRCNGQPGARCRGAVTLRARVRVGTRMRNVVIGRARYNMPVGRSLRTVAVALTGVGRRLLASSSRPVRATVAGPGVRNRAVRLTAPRRQNR